jgi:hypothetical protein|tara:strand:+ start:41 stop:553 length:513 start_codon:yes stop_codon:yes gene_type:complete
MSKPFKSPFDLLAEAYSKINYNKQAVINDYSATRKVIGYGSQVIGEGHEHGSVEEHYPEYADPNQPLEPVAIVSMDTEMAGDCGSEDHADDSEMHMAQAELYKAAEYAVKLSELLNGIESLEGWTASKITKASDYLSSVYHWLEYETKGKGRFNAGYEDAPVHPAEDSQY